MCLTSLQATISKVKQYLFYLTDYNLAMLPNNLLSPDSSLHCCSQILPRTVLSVQKHSYCKPRLAVIILLCMKSNVPI